MGLLQLKHFSSGLGHCHRVLEAALESIALLSVQVADTKPSDDVPRQKDLEG